MATPEEYAQIEQLIIQKVQNPQFENEKLDQLEKDPSCYVQLQFLLENSNSSEALMYCSKYINVLFLQNSPIWNVQLFTQIFEWIPLLIQKKIEVLFQFPKPVRIIIIDNLSKLYTYILSKLWDSNSKLSVFFNLIMNSMPDSDPHHRELRYSFFSIIIREIHENIMTQKIKTMIIADKNDTSLFNLFMEVVDLNFAREFDFSQINLIQASLELILTILQFYKKKRQNINTSDKDEATSYTCELTIHFKDVLTDANFISTLFSIFNFSKAPNGSGKGIIELLLSVIFEIVSVKGGYFSTMKEKLSFIIPVIGNLTGVMQMNITNDFQCFLQLSQIVYCMSLLLDSNLVVNIQEPLTNFLVVLQELLAPYLTDIHIFMENNEGIVNFINFWKTIISKNSNIAQFREMAYPLFQNYIQILIKSSSEDPDTIIEVFNLDEYFICESIKIIPNLLKADFATIGAPLETISRQIFECYKGIVIEKRISPEDQNQFHQCDVQMAIFVLLMTAGLRNIAAKSGIPKLTDFEVSFFKFICDVIDFTDQNIQTIFSMNGMILERAIYVFARSFRRMVFSVFNDSASVEENTLVLGHYNKIIKRLVDSLYNLHVFAKDNLFVYNNLISIQNIYNYLDEISAKKASMAQMGQQTVSYSLLIDVSREITESVATGAFQFAVNPEICLNFKNEISMLMQIVRNIVTKNQEIIKPFLLSIETKFNALASGGQSTVAVLVFIYELIGIFSDSVTKSSLSSAPATSNESFFEFYKWVFPDKLSTLAKVSPQLSLNYDIASTYLKFWYIFMSQVTEHQSKNNQSPIQKNISVFPQHSADSIILFTMITNVLVNYFQVSSGITVQSDIYKEKLKPLKNAMLLMSESLGADYIMFGAFELYNDPTLVNLLNIFIEVINGISIDLIFLHPKLALAFMKLTDALCKNHLMSIVNCSLPFFDYLFSVITVGLNQINTDLSDKAIDAGKNMGNFLQSNKTNHVIAESIVRNQPVITQIVTIGIDLYFTTSQEYNLLTLINPFMSFLPNYLQNLAEIMLPQVPQTHIQRYNEIFQELIKTVSDIYVFDKFKKTMLQLKNLANEIYLKVPVP